MTGHVILDTGPLVAFLDAGERFHPWAVDQLASVSPPLLTCQAVVAEACFVLRGYPKAIGQIGDYFDRGLIRMEFDFDAHRGRVFGLMKKYADQPMSFADACLVRMSEIVPDSHVFTLDSDVRVYRRHGRVRIPLIVPHKE